MVMSCGRSDVRIPTVAYSTRSLSSNQTVISGGLAFKHPTLGAKDHRFDPSKRSKFFQRLISRLTTSWVADHVTMAVPSPLNYKK